MAKIWLKKYCPNIDVTFYKISTILIKAKKKEIAIIGLNAKSNETNPIKILL